MLQKDTLARLWPRCPEPIIDGIVAAAPTVFPKYGLTTPLSVAVFMAHVTVECGAGTETVESGNYSAQRIVAVWPRRFPNVAAALPYAHNARALFNNVYGARMGNRPGTDDGFNNRGRGGTNVTGHDGYYALGLKMALDLLSNPDKVNDPTIFLECAVVDFVLCNCLAPALAGDMRTSTKRLNGGYTGLADREQSFKRWQAALAAEHGADAVTPPIAAKDPGTLRYGDEGFEVAGLQKQLNEKGYSVGAEDGDYHELTQSAVGAFQVDAGLPMTGVADQATKDALAGAAERPVSEARAAASADDLRDTCSRTIAAADTVGKVGLLKLAGGVGIAGSGLSLDGLQAGVDKYHQAQGLLASIREIAAPILGNAQVLVGLVIAILGAVVIFESRKIIAARLDDHRSGANLGR